MEVEQDVFPKLVSLKALEENDIRVDFIAGTSMGAVIGGLYAAGYSAKQLQEIMREMSWSDIIVDEQPRRNLLLSQKQERDRAFLQLRFQGLKPQIPKALTAGQKLHSVLTDFTLKAKYWSSIDFDHLKIPFRAVATDVISGREIVLDSGDLAEAMRASAAVPFLFSPVPKEGMLLVDGGLLNNIPVDIVRSNGMEIVIAVDATSNLREKDDFTTPLELVDQMTTIMQYESNRKQRSAADVLISLENSQQASTSFSDIDSLISQGYETCSKEN